MSESEDFAKNTIKLFRTSEHSCSYLDDLQSRTLFLDPDLEYSIDLYEELTQSGFRRSGRHLYRPDCKQCHSCIPSRIPIQQFEFKRKHKRILRKNADLHIDISAAEYRQEDYDLFEKYIAARHSDGDMYPTSSTSYNDFLAVKREFSFHIRMFMDDKLVGLAVTDRLNTGLSAIYTFFDPDLDKRSLGVFGILSQIQVCQQWDLPYLYLGYWVPNCQKMDYKTDYQPIELLINRQWQNFTPE